eukprot:jgi/Hompol1/3101/HPOL_003123-RA
MAPQDTAETDSQAQRTLTREEMLAIYKETKTKQALGGDKKQAGMASTAKRPALGRTDSNIQKPQGAAATAGSHGTSKHEAALAPAPTATSKRPRTPATSGASAITIADIREDLSDAFDHALTQPGTAQSVDTLQSYLAEESSKAVRLEIELEARTHEVLTLRALTEDLKLELNSTKRDLLQQLNVEEILRTEIIEREEQLQKVQAELTGEAAKLQATLDDKERLVRDFGQLIAELRSEIESLKSQPAVSADIWIKQVDMENLESQVHAQNLRIQQDSAELSRLRSEVADCYTAIDALEEQNRNEAAETLSMSKELDELKANTLSFETTIFVQEKDLRAKQQRIDALESALRDTIQENQSVHKTIGEKDSELKDAYTAIDLLEAQLKDAEQDIALVKQELAKYNDIESELIAHGLQLQELRDVKLKCDELERALADTLAENKSLTNLVEQQTQEIAGLKTDMHAARQVGQATISQVATIHREHSDSPEIPKMPSIEEDAVMESHEMQSADNIAADHVNGSRSDCEHSYDQDQEPNRRFSFSQSVSQGFTESQLSRDIVDGLPSTSFDRQDSSSQTDHTFDPAYWDRQVKLLKFAHNVALQKYKDTCESYVTKIKDLQEKSEIESQKWNETSNEQKLMIDKMLLAVTRSAQRVKELESENARIKQQQQRFVDDDYEDEDEGDEDEEGDDDIVNEPSHGNETSSTLFTEVCP